MTCFLLLGAALASAQPLDDATATMLRTGTTAQKTEALKYVRDLASAKYSNHLSPKAREAAKDPLPYLGDVIARLDDGSQQVRFTACIALAEFGDRAVGAVPSLRTALQDENVRLRARAAMALDGIGPLAQEAVPELVKCLDLVDPNDGNPKATQPGVVTASAFALGSIGPDAKASVPVLLKMMHSEKSYRRHVALVALGKIRSEPEKVLPVILKIATEEKDDWQPRRVAIRALGEFGAVNEKVVAAVSAPILDPLQEKDDPTHSLERTAVWAVGRLGPKALSDKVLDKLVGTLGKSDVLEPSIVDTLGRFGPAAKKALPALKEMARERRFNVNYSNAITAIEK